MKAPIKLLKKKKLEVNTGSRVICFEQRRSESCFMKITIPGKVQLRGQVTWSQNCDSFIYLPGKPGVWKQKIIPEMKRKIILGPFEKHNFLNVG